MAPAYACLHLVEAVRNLAELCGFSLYLGLEDEGGSVDVFIQPVEL